MTHQQILFFSFLWFVHAKTYAHLHRAMDAETQAGELGALEAILGDEVLFTDTQSQPYYIEVCVNLNAFR